MEAIRVLIVEDNLADTRLIEIYLRGIESLQFDCISASCLQEARKHIMDNTFDLIFLDLGLPDGQGIDSIEHIVDLSPQSSIIVMTGIYNANLASGAINVGAQDYIVKSDANSLILERTISNAMQRSRLKRELEKTQETFHAIIETANDAIITIDSDFVIHSWNKAAQFIFGYHKDEILGQQIFLLFAKTEHNSLRQQIDSTFTTSDSNNTHLAEFSAINKTQQYFPSELSLASWQSDSQQHYSLVVRDITERHKVDVIKSEFVSTVSHELRTPLTSLLGSLKLVTSGVVCAIPTTALELLEIAQSNGDRLLHLINDILDMSKLEQGHMEFHYEEAAIVNVVEEAVTLNQAYADKYGVSIQLDDVKGDYALVCTDRLRLLQVLANILSNAAKYSPKNGIVTVCISHQGSYMRISITDKGLGIPEEFQSSIFNRFTQSDSSDTRKAGGTGLGLHITKIMVEEMGGKIGFKSVTNVATTFYIDIPEATVKAARLAK
ncbi:hypothetical protein MNBD_GAMMA12-929 [hydrothermal vent metagenome]|uniref:histidine kinase n=1 Tax=hydrothermal vent metagenome TaxID=652676 RepID=A0A3B0YT29_9ZZZZ